MRVRVAPGEDRDAGHDGRDDSDRVHATTRGIRVVDTNTGPSLTRWPEKRHRDRTQTVYGDASRWKALSGNLPFGRASEPKEMADLVAFVTCA